MQLKDLWEFMRVDMDADRFENQIRTSEKRQTLLKNRNFLMEQQANMKKLEGDVADMTDRLEAVCDEVERLKKVLSGLLEDLEKNPPKSAEEAETQAEPVQKLMKSLQRYEQELIKLRKDAETRDRQQREIRVRAAKAKSEYDKLKEEYDVEFKQDTAKLKQMRARTEKESAKIEAALLEKYNSIKQHCTPPMAKLIDGQCSGCFMSLPSATLLAINEGNRLVTCDNCGRILFIEEK